MKKFETEANEELAEYELGELRSGTDWRALSSESHYRTAVEVERALLDGDYEEAEIGIKELIDSLGRSEKRALKSQLIRLMAHVIKWKTEPDRRSYSWVATIYNARDEIADIQAETPSLTDAVIRGMWEACLRSAIREAEGETNRKSNISSLSWTEVFEEAYGIDLNDQQ